MSRGTPRARINVLHLLPTLGAGGVERLFAWMAGRWSRDKYRIIAGVFYRHDVRYGAELAEAGVDLLHLGHRPRGNVDVGLVARLHRTLRTHDIHIVHAHNVTGQICSQICAVAGGTRVVVFHQHKSPTSVQRYAERVAALLPQPDLRIAVSDYVKTELEILGIGASTIEVIPNGIPLGPRRPRVPAPIDPTAPRLVSVTRLSEEKGVEYLIRAMPLVLQSAPAARLQIIGDGPLGPSLRALTVQLGVADAVEFAGFQADPLPRLDASDVFVLPSLQEGFGLALVEAMHAGVPCVATRVGAIPEIVEDGVNGLLASAGDPRGIADAVLRVVTTPALSSRLARNGAQTVGRFDLQRTVRSIESAYERLLFARTGWRYAMGSGWEWAA